MNITRPSIGLVRVMASVWPSRARRTMTCTPRVRRSSGLALGSSRRRSSSAQGPVALTTTEALNLPVPHERVLDHGPPHLAAAPLQAEDAGIVGNVSAPCSIAERIVATTSRASSHWASKYRAPPTSPRSRSIGSCAEQRALAEDAVSAHIPERGEQVVQHHPRGQLPEWNAVALVHAGR